MKDIKRKKVGCHSKPQLILMQTFSNGKVYHVRGVFKKNEVINIFIRNVINKMLVKLGPEDRAFWDQHLVWNIEEQVANQ